MSFSVGNFILRAILGKPLTPRLRDEHRQLILHRTQIGAWTAAFIYIATVLFYNGLYYPNQLQPAMMVVIPCALLAISMHFVTRFKFVQKYYQFPLAVLLAVTSNIVTNTEYQLTGGVDGFLFFPYFLIFSAMAIFLPGTLPWIIGISIVLIFGYVGSEWWVESGLNSPRFAANLAYVIDAAILCIIGNRFVYQYFVRDKQNQIKLEEVNLKLKAVDRAKTEFFANISHELKTPMTLVVTPLDNVMQKVPTVAPEVILPRETFETVRHNAYRLSGLISDLLDLTKGEIGKARIAPTEVQDPEEYFKKIFDSVTPLMKEKGLKFEFVTGPKEGGEKETPLKGKEGGEK